MAANDRQAAGFGRWGSRLGWMLAGGAACVAAWLAVHPGGVRASSAPTVVDGFMSAVQSPSSGEFPTPKSAVDFLVQQVKNQNLAQATRVLPIAYLDKNESFEWQLQQQEVLTIDSFYPDQPLSKLSAIGNRILQGTYTIFAIRLLEPQLATGQTVVARTAAQQKQLTSALDPKRLSGMSVKSIGAPLVQKGAVAQLYSQIGIDKVEFVRVTIAGVGSDRALEFMLLHAGGNWLVGSVQAPY